MLYAVCNGVPDQTPPSVDDAGVCVEFYLHATHILFLSDKILRQYHIAYSLKCWHCITVPYCVDMF
jgi:hypothetical protein